MQAQHGKLLRTLLFASICFQGMDLLAQTFAHMTQLTAICGATNVPVNMTVAYLFDKPVHPGGPDVLFSYITDWGSILDPTKMQYFWNTNGTEVICSYAEDLPSNDDNLQWVFDGSGLYDSDGLWVPEMGGCPFSTGSSRNLPPTFQRPNRGTTNSVVLQLVTYPGFFYSVEWSTNLSKTATWNEIWSDLAWQTSVRITNKVDSAMKFYRAVVH